MMIATNTFGRARLPNDKRAFQKSLIGVVAICDRKRLARRAVGTRIMQRFDPNLLPRFGTWHTLGRRLGARVCFDRMQEPQPSWIPGKGPGSSGASPHQGFGSGIALGMEQSSALSDGPLLMTKNNFFVPYFNHLVVPL
jgi:hypothetical protein